MKTALLWCEAFKTGTGIWCYTVAVLTWRITSRIADTRIFEGHLKTFVTFTLKVFVTEAIYTGGVTDRFTVGDPLFNAQFKTWLTFADVRLNTSAKGTIEV
jgi:hypothetical protein